MIFLVYISRKLSVIHRLNIILVFSPQSSPIARSLAMYRDPLTGLIVAHFPRVYESANDLCGRFILSHDSELFKYDHT